MPKPVVNDSVKKFIIDMAQSGKWSVSDICVALDMNRNTVKNIVNRARHATKTRQSKK